MVAPPVAVEVFKNKLQPAIGAYQDQSRTGTNP